ncbi:S-layer homology domain-containing protein, partial [Paenibacillus hemerocallicola]
SVYNSASGNALTALRWALGERTAADFAGPTFGSDVPPSGSFSVTTNGKYTVFALDAVGHSAVRTIEITNIVNTPPTQQPIDLDTGPGPAPLSESSKFSLEPGKAYTLTFEGLTLHIPAGAIERPTIISVEHLKNQIQHLLRPDQSLLSDAFELTKDVAGKFKMPIRLSFEWSDGKLGANQRAVLAYFDEVAAEWVVLGGTIDGNTLSGETDHFTKFAVLAYDALPEPGLTDIAGHWAESAIREGVAKGVLEGYPDGTFCPDRPVSRAEFTLLLQRIMAWPNGGRLSFQDTNDIPSWAADAIAAAVQARAVSGYPDDTFRPNANINRTEMVVLIAKAAGLRTSEAKEAAYADADEIAGWSRPFIVAAHEAGLIEGQSGNLFQPLASATRAEAIVLLLRMAAYMQTPDT